MGTSDTIVFLGPSLPRAEAERILPAEYLPPAAMGDIYRAVSRPARQRPRRIALIDGYFERMAAPWHKEILWALERGAQVYGASSMGALRAAELEVFGMVGVGQIFEDFRAGRLTDDDEVAVLHGPEERGWPQLSEAMVNLRAGVAEAKAAGVLTAETADALIAVGKGQFYRDRSWESLIGRARAQGLPEQQLTLLEQQLKRRRPDQKAEDARCLLTLLARGGEAAPARPKVKMARTWFWWRFVEVMEEG